LDEGESTDDLVGRPRQRPQRGPRVLLVAGLAVDLAVQRDERVDPQDGVALDGQRLAPRVLERDVLGVAGFELGRVGRPDLVVDPELAEDRRALRRPRRQY
jgi:hypothetical protein